MPVFLWYIQLIGLKNALFLFPGIPTGDPAIVAFYDKCIYKKLRLKELSLSDPVPPFTDRSRRDIHCIDKRGSKWEVWF
jgi:hypothetical protein